MTSDVRPSAVSGMFYPSDPAKLHSLLQGLFGRAAMPAARRAVSGLIAPHAGYAYSGTTAAAGYAALTGAKYDTVVIVSPSHREFFDGVTVYPGDAYATPLGEVPVHKSLRSRLLERCTDVRLSRRGHGEEHAVEVHLPFLQYQLSSFALLPLVIGHQTRAICYGLGECLADILRGERALLVASTDLSHYHSAPVADRMDQLVIDAVNAFDPGALMDLIDSGGAEACGGGPMVVAMLAARMFGANKAHLLKYANSGDVTGDKSSVVGYASAAYYK